MGQFDLCPTDVGGPLFVFGSLMDRDLLAQVLDRDIADLGYTSGTVHGFRRRRVRGESFPILLPRARSRVEGMVIHGLSQADIARLEFFESEYELRPVQVTTAQGRLLARKFAHTERLEDAGEGWCFESWRRWDKELALVSAEGWMSYFGRDLSEVEALWPQIKQQAALRLPLAA